MNGTRTNKYINLPGLDYSKWTKSDPKAATSGIQKI